jgi:putative DNA primase/helicase
LWLRFLGDVFENDADTIEAVQRLLGYTLTGLCTDEIMVIAYGYGANGKSVFGNVVHSIMGGYSTVAASSLLVTRPANNTGPRDDLAALAGARHVSINELQSGDKLDERVVKVLAGREPISARYLYGSHFTYQPTFTAWLRTNHKPIIHGTDEGIWRRLVLLPFKRQFAPEERDPKLEQKLMAERDGILAWIVAGAVAYLREGLRLSAAMKTEQATYRKESDLMGEFLQDSTQTAPNERIEQSRLYTAWQSWCGFNGVQYGSKKSFTRRLTERGIAEARSNGQRYYCGLKLLV